MLARESKAEVQRTARKAGKSNKQKKVAENGKVARHSAMCSLCCRSNDYYSFAVAETSLSNAGSFGETYIGNLLFFVGVIPLGDQSSPR